MVDSMLEEHSLDKVGKVLSRAQIRTLLLTSGWPSDSVESYLDSSMPEKTEGVILQCRNLSKKFGKNSVIQNADFDVISGEIFGIVGMSGAGKTTLMNMLVGFLQPDSGDVMINLKDSFSIFSDENRRSIMGSIGFSTQRPSFFSKLSVVENIEHFSILYGLPKKQMTSRAKEILKLVGLSDAKDVLAENLSGGMQKRLDIACSLIHNPSVLFLDEPTSDLDPLLRHQMWDLIRDINKKGTTIILSSHFLSDVEVLCDRIAILFDKKIVDIGSSDDLRNTYSRKFQISFESKSGDYVKIRKLLKGFAPKLVDNKLVVESASPLKALGIIVKHAKDLKSLNVARPSLGHVFDVLVKK